MASQARQRTEVEAYITVNGKTYRCSEGWLAFTESFNPNIKSRKYLNRRNPDKEITGYSPTYYFECLLMPDKPEILTVYQIAAGLKTGDDAVLDVTVDGRSFRGLVEVTSIDDDDDMIMKGTIHRIYDKTDDNGNNNNNNNGGG